jgi:hypothetical protein
MTESFLNYVSLALCGTAVSWVLLCRLIARRLNLRHPQTYIAMRGPARLPKNSIDWLSSFLQFLYSSRSRELQDPAMARLCLLIKACTVSIFLLFVLMMFSPFFLPGSR